MSPFRKGQYGDPQRASVWQLCPPAPRAKVWRARLSCWLGNVLWPRICSLGAAPGPLQPSAPSWAVVYPVVLSRSEAGLGACAAPDDEQPSPPSPCLWKAKAHSVSDAHMAVSTLLVPVAAVLSQKCTTSSSPVTDTPHFLWSVTRALAVCLRLLTPCPLCPQSSSRCP